MFRTVSLSIIRSSSLYTQRRYMSYRFADSLRAGSGRSYVLILLISQIYFWNKTTCFGQFLCPSSGDVHCTHSNGICAGSMRAGSERSSFLILLIPQIYFWNKTLHVSDSSSVHHQEFFTVHTTMVYVIQVCWKLASRISSVLILLASCQQSSMKYTIAVCTVKNCW